MTRIGSFVTVAGLVLATPLVGQGSKSIDAFATVVISPALSLAKDFDLNFGTHFASDGKITSASAGSTPAVWKGDTDVGTCLSLAFTTLPKQLTRMGSTDVVPVVYGTTSGAFSGATLSTFNPDGTGVANLQPDPTNGAFFVGLGAFLRDVNTDVVSVDLTNAPAGTYSATIMLTVMVGQCPAP